MKRSIRILLPISFLAGAGCDSEDPCAGDHCAPPLCDPGTDGCDCLTGGRCLQADGPAVALVCEGDACRLRGCSDGTADCSCTDAGSCNDGTVCVAGRCVGEPSQALPPPDEAVCYTPCSQGLALADGSYIPCSNEGLMAACLGGTTCVEGSCVSASDGPRTCAEDADCPDYQACAAGRCRSNCELDTDCPAPLVCYRKVCRLPCSASSHDCAAGQFCTTVDGEVGHCMPVADPSGEPHEEVAGAFIVSETRLGFSNIEASRALSITNDSPSAQTFTVRKVRHTERTPSGPVYDTDNPLYWLQIGPEGAPVLQQEIDIRVEAGGTAVIEVAGAANPALPAWDGVLEVSNEDLGSRRVSLSYVETVQGRWSGRMVYFTSFGETGLDAWVAAGRPDNDVLTVGNAFIQKWSAFKNGRILTHGEWLAILAATQSESWDWTSTRALCTGPNDLGPQGRCFLYDGVPKGWVTYSNNVLSTPIPSGVVDFPFQVHLRRSGADPTALSGRIDTGGSLHYPGNAALSLQLATDPSDTGSCRSVAGNCFVDIVGLQADVRVGGRYLTEAADSSCSRAPGFELTRVPWLVDGFAERTDVDDESGLRYRYECRNPSLPFANPANDPRVAAVNLSMAGSNPVPDGNTRRRRFELVDGALINNDAIFVIFKETFQSFLEDDFSAYGYILLERAAAELESEDYVGSLPDDSVPNPPSALGATCRAETLTAVGLAPTLPSGSLDDVAMLLLDGIDTTTPATFLPSGSGPPYVHYLCVGVTPGDPTPRAYFDGGPDNTAGDSIACPPGSTVRFFVLDGMDDHAVAGLPCQQAGSCDKTFATWEENCAAGACIDGLRVDPAWRCAAANEVYCDADRLDLRRGKQFYDEPAMTSRVLVPLATEVDDAFRYRTRFRSRSGTGLGFAPEICAAGSGALPYCYDPQAIEIAAGRTDCLTTIFSTRYDDLSLAVQRHLLDYLKQSFAWYPLAGGTPTNDGFERLYAELLIMLGDDAFTRAFASRFDLAGSAVYGFEGSLFEPGGIDLSGGAGFEMVQLYRATQYYQQALDRFYAQLPYVWQAVRSGDATRNFVTLGTVTAYLDRVIRASTQKARVASEIAKRYQRFKRPDLARHVVERGYASMYMESVILAQLMLRMVDAVEPPKRPQVVAQIRFASLGYRSALMQMQGVYDDFSDDLVLFGFSPEYVPFPALDTGATNAFDALFASALSKAAVAAEKEQQALDASRTFDTDAVSFQNELTRIRNNYEGQLARLCGTMLGEDGAIYPAIPKYAHLNELARLMGNPCGFAGNGDIHEAMAGIELAGLDLELIIRDTESLLDEVDLEVERVSAQCDQIFAKADYLLEKKNEVHTLESEIGLIRAGLKVADGALDLAKWKAQQEKCLVVTGTANGTDCAGAIAGSALVTAMTVVNKAAHVAGEAVIGIKEDDITAVQDGAAWWETTQECTAAKIDSEYRVKTLLLRLKELDLEGVKAQYRLALAASRVRKLHNEAQRLVSERAETEQQTINLEAARNDPNVRIYKNDAVLTADRTFNAAVREAYKATKVFEYYTSQSYGLLGDLFLVRMVAHGDMSLEYYLDNLEQAFVEFEEQYGNPDVRVAILSLRDDIMQIPRLDADNRSVTYDDRVEAFRRRLVDVGLLDEHGYTTVPFSTSLSTLSPLTRNHKVHYVEAEIVGSDAGDPVARLYLRQAGTGVVRGVDDKASYFSFPERTAVINPFLNGERVFPGEIYRSDRLKDRPFVNTRWEIVLNQRDEHVNKDINVNSLTDIRLYVYYTDFTPF